MSLLQLSQQPINTINRLSKGRVSSCLSCVTMAGCGSFNRGDKGSTGTAVEACQSNKRVAAAAAAATTMFLANIAFVLLRQQVAALTGWCTLMLPNEWMFSQTKDSKLNLLVQ